MDLIPHSGHVSFDAVATLAGRWRQREPSPRHPTPAACLTVVNARRLLLDALWARLPAATPQQREDRQVRAALE